MYQYGGYAGRLLYIDLTNSKMDKINLDSLWAEELIGGNGFAVKILYDMVQPKIDPLDEKNVLIFMTGPLQGTRIPACGNRLAIITKSPLTNLFMGSYVGGTFGAELKFAGYDGVVVSGKSKKPVYLFIKDDLVELRDAKQLWGLDTSKTQVQLLEMTAERKASTLCIGPAGEKKVKIACIISETHAAGRGGTGAVMGAKGLKAIIVKGSKSINIMNREKLKDFSKDFIKKIKNNPVTGNILPNYGTTLSVDGSMKLGLLGTRNWQSEVFEDADKISGEVFRGKYKIKNTSCFGCPIGCAKVYKISEGKYKGTVAEGPEYETIWALGSNCGNGNPEVIIKGDKICDDLGIDTISAGAAIGLSMECYEKGIISPKETSGLELKWGDEEIILTLLEQIGNNEGFGKLLGNGTKYMSKKYDVEKLTCECKGLEIPAHSPRGLPGMALGYATSNRGGSHQDGRPTAEKSGLEDRFTFKGKGKFIANVQRQTAIADCLICCRFTEAILGIKNITQETANMLNIVTGMTKDVNDLSKIADRICALERAFNVREGITRKDDILPFRVMNVPIPDGPSKGQYIDKDKFELELNNYYKERGWDINNGIPSRQTLVDLNLEYVADDLHLSSNH